MHTGICGMHISLTAPYQIAMKKHLQDDPTHHHHHVLSEDRGRLWFPSAFL